MAKIHNIHIDGTLHKALKVEAAKQGKTLRGFVSEGLALFLDISLDEPILAQAPTAVMG